MTQRILNKAHKTELLFSTYWYRSSILKLLEIYSSGKHLEYYFADLVNHYKSVDGKCPQSFTSQEHSINTQGSKEKEWL